MLPRSFKIMKSFMYRSDITASYQTQFNEERKSFTNEIQEMVINLVEKQFDILHALAQAQKQPVVVI